MLDFDEIVIDQNVSGYNVTHNKNTRRTTGYTR